MNNARITIDNYDEDAFHRAIDEALANIDINELLDGLGFADRFIGEHKFENKASFTDDEVERYLKDQVTQELDLARYDITYSAALTNKTAHLLAAREDIQSLNIEDNNLDDEGIELLASIPNLTSLEIGGNYLTDACTEVLKTHTKLQRLDLRASYAYMDDGYQLGTITENGADNLSQNESIRSLNLSGQPIGDNGAIKLSSNKYLNSLKLKSCNITDIGAISLANSENLTQLNLANNHSVSDVSIVALAASSHLKSLNLEGCNITDTGLVALAQTNLTALNVNGLLVEDDINHLTIEMGNITDNGAQHLFHNPSLTALNIDHQSISELCRINLEERVRFNKINKLLNTSFDGIKRQFNWGTKFNFFNRYRPQAEKESFSFDVEIMFSEDDSINNTM